MIQNEQHLFSAFCLLPPEVEGNSSWRDPRPNAVHLIGFGKSIRKMFRRAPPHPPAGRSRCCSRLAASPSAGVGPARPALHRTVRGPGWRKRRLRSTLSPKGAERVPHLLLDTGGASATDAKTSPEGANYFQACPNYPRGQIGCMALSLGERVSRDRRFHQLARDG